LEVKVCSFSCEEVEGSSGLGGGGRFCVAAWPYLCTIASWRRLLEEWKLALRADFVVGGGVRIDRYVVGSQERTARKKLGHKNERRGFAIPTCDQLAKLDIILLCSMLRRTVGALLRNYEFQQPVIVGSHRDGGRTEESTADAE